MQKLLYQDKSGSVILGLVMPCGLLPVMVWPTWSEFTAHVDFEMDFIKYTMAHSMPGAVQTYINSLEQIDKVK